MSSSAEDSPKSSRTERAVHKSSSSAITSSDRSPQMAVSLEPHPDIRLPSTAMFTRERPTLPPIVSIDEFHRGFSQPPMVAPPTGGNGTQYTNPRHNIIGPSSTAPSMVTDRFNEGHRRDDVFHSVCSSPQDSNSGWTSHTQAQGFDSQSILTKRSYDTMSQPSERYPQHHHYPSGGPLYPDTSGYPYHSSYSSTQSKMSSTKAYPLAAANVADLSLSQTQHSNKHRCSLHIRQQPRAARAGPDGKDRRAIDPPPVLQLLLSDFDINSEEDLGELRSSYYVVHCRLVSAQSPRKDMSTLSSTNDDGSTEVQRLLLGTSVASPFFCADDPDIETMPKHPKSKDSSTSGQAPPSPTSRFIMPRSAKTGSKTSKEDTYVPGSLPGTFFIFADLSIRRAGEYRLEFCLMKVEPATMIAGSRLPILHSVTSQVFKVVNAKDFDQVQPSTDLVKGLLDRGAGFPLKLKKGTREGGRRRNATDSEGGGGGSLGGAEDDEEDDDDDDEDG